jgi:hypothetical protein
MSVLEVEPVRVMLLGYVAAAAGKAVNVRLAKVAAMVATATPNFKRIVARILQASKSTC